MRAEELYLLDLGWLGGDCGWFLPGAAGGAATAADRNPPRKWVEIPVTAVVVRHPDGVVLFDAGVAPDANQTHDPGVVSAFPVVRFSEENRIEEQLGRIGLRPEDVRFIVISHLHFDHVGQLGPFLAHDIPIIVQKRELEAALYMLWQGKGGAYDFTDLERLRGARWAPIQDDRFELLEGVWLEKTGGHTAGHQVMHVQTAPGRWYTFTGDYLHIPDEYRLEAKGWLLGDAEEWHAYIRKLKVMERARQARLVLSHDPELWSKYPAAPNPLP
ncbi:MAG: N-acyl homoserine lactonase family protein [Chloroflexi bacterium]|nr:N-acyl homoserine lactonase family protein [Chloroflexota bacterium]